MNPDLILPHDGVLPIFASSPTRCGRGSTVIGTSTIGARAELRAFSVIRGDGQTIAIGDDIHLGAFSTVHIATETHPTLVGDRVTVGRNAVVHACTVGSDVVVEDDAVILDGSVVADGVLIEAGAIVFPRSSLEAGTVYAGSPAKPQRTIDRSELAQRAERIRGAGDPATESASADLDRLDATAFVGANARLSGRITLGAGSVVLFSCVLDATAGPITVGADTNIQDNSVIRAGTNGVVIGRETTVGHNVRMEDCRIGGRSLIGIGCVLAPGTVVADEVLLAAGAVTEPGQLLEGGHLWGGRPARILSKLDDGKRRMMAQIVEGYCEHGRAYRRLQAATARSA